MRARCCNPPHCTTPRLITFSRPSCPSEILCSKYGLSPSAVAHLSPLDRDFAPSGVLLRDVFCALLRVASGRAVAVDEQPTVASLASDESEVSALGVHAPPSVLAPMWCCGAPAAAPALVCVLLSPATSASPLCPPAPPTEPAAVARARVQRGVGNDRGEHCAALNGHQAGLRRLSGYERGGAVAGAQCARMRTRANVHCACFST